MDIIKPIENCRNDKMTIVHIKYEQLIPISNNHYISLTAFSNELADEADETLLITLRKKIELYNHSCHVTIKSFVDIFNNLTSIGIIGFGVASFDIFFLKQIIDSKKIDTLVIQKCDINLKELFRILTDSKTINKIIVDGSETNICKQNELGKIVPYLQFYDLVHLELPYCFNRYDIDSNDLESFHKTLMQQRKLRRLNILTGTALTFGDEDSIIKLARYNYRLIKISYNPGLFGNMNEIEKQLTKNNSKVLNIKNIKICMLIMRTRKDCVINIVPRRVLIYLLSFIDDMYY